MTDPPSGGAAAARGIVVIVPDLFGWKLNNSRVLADRYAERAGYTVYLPDFMDGIWSNTALYIFCGERERGRIKVFADDFM